MDVYELFRSCKNGDYDRIQCLVESKDVDLNIRDEWDSSPLYYACLCGHEEVVRYLLQNGARCDANTFDGERCLYGALTDNIKKLLQNYKQITTNIMRRDVYNEFLRHALDRGIYGDVKFEVQSEMIHAHRCVLMARSEYFMDMFCTKWKEKDCIELNKKFVLPWAFRLILKYLYTGQMDVQIENVDAVIMLARQCRMHELIEKLDDRLKRAVSFMEASKPGVRITILSLVDNIENDENLKNDLGFLADNCLPQQVNSLIELPFAPEKIDTSADVIFDVNDRLFYCHKLFFCGRSDYFKVLTENHFGEITLYIKHIPVLELNDISVDVFVQVLYYLYQDSCQDLNEHNVYDVLVAADMFLLPDLKRQCGKTIAQHLDAENVTANLKMAELFSLPRLQDLCKEFMAVNIEKILEIPEFVQFVKEDAKCVQDRHETDTIPVIDDIRYHIANSVQNVSDMQEAEKKISLIDNFLMVMDLDG